MLQLYIYARDFNFFFFSETKNKTAEKKSNWTNNKVYWKLNK